VARYIERNPVRANIVKRAEDYVWSSARAHVLKVRDTILSSEGWLGESEFNAYREFLTGEDKNIEDSIRKATSTGRPLGSKELIEDLGKTLDRDTFPKKAGRPRSKTS
jgi:putative transposase